MSGKANLIHVTVFLVKCHFTTGALLVIYLYKYEQVVPVIHEVEEDKDDIIRVAILWYVDFLIVHTITMNLSFKISYFDGVGCGNVSYNCLIVHCSCMNFATLIVSSQK